MSETWFRQAADGSLTLTLHVQPNASRTEAAGLHGEALKLRLAAPPVDGKANSTLIAWFADFAHVAKSQVELVAGASARKKLIRISGADAASVARLKALAG